MDFVDVSLGVLCPPNAPVMWVPVIEILLSWLWWAVDAYAEPWEPKETLTVITEEGIAREEDEGNDLSTEFVWLGDIGRP